MAEYECVIVWMIMNDWKQETKARKTIFVGNFKKTPHKMTILCTVKDSIREIEGEHLVQQIALVFESDDQGDMVCSIKCYTKV